MSPHTDERAAALAGVEEAFASFASRSSVPRMLERFAAEVGGGIDPSGYPVLARLESWGPIRTTELAERLTLDVSTVSRRVRDLEETGLVRRVEDPDDRRAHLLETTVKGRRLTAKMREVRRATLDRALAEWSPAEIRELADVLGRFSSALAEVL